MNKQIKFTNKYLPDGDCLWGSGSESHGCYVPDIMVALSRALYNVGITDTNDSFIDLSGLGIARIENFLVLAANAMGVEKEVKPFLSLG